MNSTNNFINNLESKIDFDTGKLNENLKINSNEISLTKIKTLNQNSKLK